MSTRDPISPTPDESTLVHEHLPLVHYAVNEIAHRIPRHVLRDDLVSAGMFGLARAARGFDADRGINFDAYAMIRIRGALLDELRSRDWASRSVRSRARKMEAAKDTLTQAHGRTPTDVEIAAQMGVDIQQVQKIIDDVHKGTVLNYESLVTDGDITDVMPAGQPTPAEELLARERKAYLMDAVVALPERLRHVVVGYFFEERPMLELADELGVSESRISQMRAEALTLMRTGMISSLDPEMLPEESRPDGRLAKKRAAYCAAVAAGSTARARLSADEQTSRIRLAAAG